MKIVKWFSDNILLIFTLFLLAFIPLYPKFPLIDIKNTWVYVRVEDFLVLIAGIIFFVQLLRRKVTLRTPLTIPIIAFWVIGAISTISAIYFIFPTINNVDASVAILHFLRRVEYLSLFFIAFFAVREKRHIPYVIGVLCFTLLAVVAYGFGQKSFNFSFEVLGKLVSFGWPQVFYAYSTMNEEFAKGIPLRLSDLARVPSTFAGHYDLAAYLVMLIPLMGSLVFGVKKLYGKFFFFFCAFAGLILLLMTASRVSFGVYIVTICFMLVLQKQKKFIIPVVVLSIMLLQSFQGISERFNSTIKQVDVVVDARTGKAVGIVNTSDKTDATMPLVIEEQQSTGETLPQGTAFINLPAKDSQGSAGPVVYKRSLIKAGTTSAEITSIQGDFVVKKVLAYDVSFTTRFQGEWPRALEALNRNVLLGSGYSSISLATDNNYLRILGEVGFLGLSSFILIFLVFCIYTYHMLPHVDSRLARSFILGVLAGVFGLGLNAVLIDVFEASKVAFVLWMLIGVSMGVLHLYQKKDVEMVYELRKVLSSVPVLIVYLTVIASFVFAHTVNNYFIGDDFTWLRWAAECEKILINGMEQCEPFKATFLKYFTDADGFFYRPGMKVYFFLMYAVFWINQMPYHVASLLIHIFASSLVFLISLRVLKSRLFGFITAVFFLVLSGHFESLLWISSIGHLLASSLVLASLMVYIWWKETRHILYLMLAFLTGISATFFHELGIVTPVLIIFYDVLFGGHATVRFLFKQWQYALMALIIPLYLSLRYMARSHWLNGDYSYSLMNLPFNIVGNAIGYTGLTLYGNAFLSLYDQWRVYGRDHKQIMVIAIIFGILVLLLLGKLLYKKITRSDITVVGFAIGVFFISLLPFIGLGNVATRYVYLASFGILLILVYLLQKLFVGLLKVHKIVAYVVLLGIVFLFTTFHIVQFWDINKDWKTAGTISNNLLINFNSVYAKILAPNPVFYFVNVPIRYNSAWVFPVGLNDALWFTFQNENLTVHTVPSLDAALQSAEASSSARVFEFDKEGNIEEVIRASQ